MLSEFFFELRKRKVNVGLQQWLALMEAVSMGLHRSSLDGFYNVARSLLVTSEADFDNFDQTFAYYFKGVEIAALQLSEEALEWLKDPVSLAERLTPEQLEYFSQWDIDELRELFEKTLQEQKERHDGGNRWIGTGGRSPFGWGGQHPGGIRVGGQRWGGSAMQVAAQRRYRAYREDLLLDTRQIRVALRKLRELTRLGRQMELDVDATIDKTCRNAGELELVYRARRRNNIRVILLMDVGGSMDPHAAVVSRLFSAAHASNHFKDFKYFYFHNCVYEHVYKEADFAEGITVSELTRTYSPDYKLIMVGDALMHPAELLRMGGSIYYWDWNPKPGAEYLKQLSEHFRRSVWLNPEPKRVWRHVTVRSIRQYFPMYSLTLAGLKEAVSYLVQGRKKKPPIDDDGPPGRHSWGVHPYY